MDIENLKKLFINSSKTQKIFIILFIFLLLFIILYQTIFSVFISNIFSMREELRARKRLYDAKMEHAQFLKEIKIKYSEIADALSEINKPFFTVETSESFLKNLPNLIQESNNRLIVLKPKSEGFELRRSERLKKYIQTAKVKNEKQLIMFINDNKDKINANIDSNKLMRQALKMVPTSQEDPLRILWQQPENPISKLKLQKINLSLIIQGRYEGLVDLFNKFNDFKEIIDLKELKIEVIKGRSPEIESSFNLSIYVLSRG